MRGPENIPSEVNEKTDPAFMEYEERFMDEMREVNDNENVSLSKKEIMGSILLAIFVIIGWSLFSVFSPYIVIP